jgi:AAA15 family ATPase/GTPase
MNYVSFIIENFKGIQKLNLSFEKTHNSPIILLVGLNESGKTTILETLSFFFDNIKKDQEIRLTSNVVDDVHDLIPKGEKDNFNKSILIKTHIIISNNDKMKISKYFSERKYTLAKIEDNITLTLDLKYENSQFKMKNTFFDINMTLKKKGEKKVKQYSDKHEMWNSFYEYFNSLLPSIIYYPNFLFNFPDKIYLSELTNENTVHKEQPFYRTIIQDILDSIGNSLSIKTHLIERFKSDKASDGDALESVINKMSEQLTKTIIQTDYSIFSLKEGNREVLVSRPKLDTVNNNIYVELKLKEGSNSYYIRERSLGFKWFFSFLLFTQYRIARQGDGNRLYFLFDEPASNLHQTAQQRILKALETMTAGESVSIIYTTHSHHLINPRWLESTFIVKNSALNYENDTTYDTTQTNIQVEPYRKFVSKHPDQRYYYQPILDVLEYKPSNIEFVPNILMVEKKTDYYIIKYFNDIYIKEPDVYILPGGGSGSLSKAIQLYLAWGREFTIILDSDKEGKKAKDQYIEEFGVVVKDRIFDLSSINNEWKNNGIEKLFTQDEKIMIQTSIFPGENKYNKKLFNSAIQELYITNRKLENVNTRILENIKSIIIFYKSKINQKIAD